MEKALNIHLNEEFSSAYLYLSMATYCETKSLKGFANWMLVQYQEEMFHAMKFYTYINDRGGKVILQAVNAPKNTWENKLNVFEEVYEHEKKISKMVNDLVDVAVEEKDHATQNFLQWFVSEQVEEEANACDVVEQLKYIDGNGPALLMLDKELRQRQFTLDTTQDKNV